MFRQIVLLLVAYPLLLPPGMCICGAMGARDGRRRLSPEGRSHGCSLGHCGRKNVSSDPCGGAHGVPTDKQCPPSCPASKQADHSKLADRRPVATVYAAAVTPQTFCVDVFAERRLSTPSMVSLPPAEPIYIALCTLRI
jgi:hypothetical protein